jgi:ligand-binding sensor domain-containing protein
LQQCVSDAPIIELDGINAVLLDDQEVRAVAVDAANRKWFGTTSGVYVLSADGRTQVANFSTENSPLPANDVTDITFDNNNGYAYIGTSNGIAVLRTEAVAGGGTNKLSAYAFPNPVQPDYEGPIAITGLAQDADVRMTDTAGQLIWLGKAFGGQAVWDGRDYTGRRAASGVYLVFSTANNPFGSPDTLVAKIVVMRGPD